MNDLKLPIDHRLREFPDDFKLYELVVERLRKEPMDHFLDICEWAYATAREHKIPAECVSKVLAAVRRYEGLGVI